MFFTAELESEARKPSSDRLSKWRFNKNADEEVFVKEVVDEAQTCLYSHTPSSECSQKGK